MDSITQFLLGAVVGQLVLGRRSGKGALLGGIAGTLPDCDILPLIKESVVTQLHYHRGVSHSLLFGLLAPVFFAYGSRLLQKKSPYTLTRWYLFWMLAFITHSGLDALTSWGTQLLWPNTTKFSFNALFIIDPLVTLPLLIGCILTWRTKKRRPAAVSLGLTCTYITFALCAQGYMTHAFLTYFQSQQLPITAVFVRPTPFNTLFWTVTAVNNNTDSYTLSYARLWDPISSFTHTIPAPRNTSLLKTTHTSITQLDRILATTGPFYRADRTPHHVHIHDLRYGHMTGWHPKNPGPFTFTYSYSLAKQYWFQARPSIKNTSLAFKTLVDAIIAPRGSTTET